jgi:hypothetical protein
MANEAWAPYVASVQMLWDLRRVVHLHRRAGFAATWTEWRRDLQDGPGPSIDRLLAGKSRSDGVPKEFAATADYSAVVIDEQANVAAPRHDDTSLGIECHAIDVVGQRAVSELRHLETIRHAHAVRRLSVQRSYPREKKHRQE